MPAAIAPPAPPSRRVCKSILLGLLGAKVLTSVPISFWESSGLGPAAGLGLDLGFAMCLTSSATLTGWTRATAWKGGAIALASFSLTTAGALVFWRFGQATTDALDLWIRLFRLSALSAALVANVAAFGPPVIRTDA